MDFKTKYKQTLLGSLWFIIPLLLEAFILDIVFGNIANLSSYGRLEFLFYLVRDLSWLFFTVVIKCTYYYNFTKIFVPIFLRAG